jgi:hypothetical protein
MSFAFKVSCDGLFLDVVNYLLLIPSILLYSLNPFYMSNFNNNYFSWVNFVSILVSNIYTIFISIIWCYALIVRTLPPSIMHIIIISPCRALWLLCSSSNWEDINLSTIPWSFLFHSDYASSMAFFIPLVLIQ